MKTLFMTLLLTGWFVTLLIAQDLPCKQKYSNQNCAARYNIDSKGNPHGLYIEYSEEGKVIRRGTYQNGIKIGSWFDSSDGIYLFHGGPYLWYDKGNLIVGSMKEIASLEEAYKLKQQKAEVNKKTEMITIDGKQYKAEYQLNSWGNCYVGTYKVFYLSNKPYKVSSFKDCQEEGDYFLYYENGKLLEKGRYEYGKKSGIVEKFYEDGKLRWKATFKMDKENGLWEQYYQNGNIQLKFNYLDGKLSGLSEDYYEDGSLHHKMSYKNDLEDGIQETYYTSGKLEKSEKIQYEMGWETPIKKITYTETYFTNGKVEIKGTTIYDMKTGKEFKNGLWEWYDESGNLIKKDTY